MQGYNCIAVFNEDADKVLMCRRKKNPYMGLSNFVSHIMMHIEMYKSELLK